MLQSKYSRLQEDNASNSEDGKFVPYTTLLWNKWEALFFNLMRIASPDWNAQYTFIYCIIWLLTTLQLCRFISNAYIAYDWNSRVAVVWIAILDAISEFPGSSWTQYIVSVVLICFFYLWMLISSATHKYLRWNVPVYFLSYLLKWIPSFLFMPLILPQLKMVFPCFSYSRESYTVHPFFDDLTCWEFSHIGLSILSFVLMSTFIAISFAITLVFYNSQIPKAEQYRDNAMCARVNNYPEAYLILAKSLALILFIASNSDSWRIALSIILTLTGLGLVYLNALTLPFWDDAAQSMYILQGMLCAWTGVIAFLTTVLNDATGTGMLFFVGMPLFMISAPALVRYRMYTLQHLQERHITADYLIELKARYFIRRFYKYILTLGDIYVEPTEEIRLRRKIHFELVEHTLSLGAQRFPKSVDLQCFLAQMYTTVQYNRVLAYRAIKLAEENNPHFSQRYIISALNDILIAATTQERSGEVAEYVEFQEKMKHVQSTTASAMQYLVHFWTELLKSAPNIDRLAEIGERARHDLSTAVSHYERLLTLNPNSVPLLRAYGMLCMEVSGEIDKALLMFDRADAIEREKRSSALDLNYGKFLNVLDTHISLFEDRNGILSMSVNPEDMGTILSVNSSLLRYFGYTENDMLGKSINLLIPEPIRSVHDLYIERYLNIRKSNVVNNVRLVLGVHAQFHLVPVLMHVRWSDEASGKMIASMSPVVKPYEMCVMVDPNNYKITYATYNVTSIYGFPKRDILARQIHLSHLVPTFRDSDGEINDAVLNELYSNKGHKCIARHVISSQKFNVHVFANRIDVMDESVIFVRAEMSHIQEEEEIYNPIVSENIVPDTDETELSVHEASETASGYLFSSPSQANLFSSPSKANIFSSPSQNNLFSSPNRDGDEFKTPPSATGSGLSTPLTATPIVVDTGFVEEAHESFLGNSAFKSLMLSKIQRARTKANLEAGSPPMNGISRGTGDSGSQRGGPQMLMRQESLFRASTLDRNGSVRSSGQLSYGGARQTIERSPPMGQRPLFRRSASGRLDVSGSMDNPSEILSVGDLNISMRNSSALTTTPQHTSAQQGDNDRDSLNKNPLTLAPEARVLTTVAEDPDDNSTCVQSPISPMKFAGNQILNRLPSLSKSATLAALSLQTDAPKLGENQYGRLPSLHGGLRDSTSTTTPTVAGQLEDVNNLSIPSLKYTGIELERPPVVDVDGYDVKPNSFGQSLTIPGAPALQRSPTHSMTPGEMQNHTAQTAMVSARSQEVADRTAAYEAHVKAAHDSFISDLMFRKKRRAMKKSSQTLLKTAIHNDDMLTVRKLVWMKFFAFFMILLVIAASITLYIVSSRFLDRAELLVTNVYRSSQREAYMVDTLYQNKLYQLLYRNPDLAGAELIFFKVSSFPLWMIYPPFNWTLRQVAEYGYATRRDQSLEQFERLSNIIDQTPSTNHKLLQLRTQPILPAWEREGLAIKMTKVSLRDGVSRFSAYLRHSNYMSYLTDIEDPGFFYAMSNAIINFRTGMQLNTLYTMEEMNAQHQELIDLVIAIFAVSASAVIFVAFFFVQPLVRRVEESRNRVLFIFQSVPPTIRRSLRKKAYQMYAMMNTERDVLEQIGVEEKAEDDADDDASESHDELVKDSDERKHAVTPQTDLKISHADESYERHPSRSATPSSATAQRYQNYLNARQNGASTADVIVPGDMTRNSSLQKGSVPPTPSNLAKTPTSMVLGANDPLKQRYAKADEAVMASRKRDAHDGTGSANNTPSQGAIRGDVTTIVELTPQDDDNDSREDSRGHRSTDGLTVDNRRSSFNGSSGNVRDLAAAQNSGWKAQNGLTTIDVGHATDADNKQMDLEKKARKSLLSRKSVQILALRYIIYLVCLCIYFSILLSETITRSREVENSMKVMTMASRRSPSLQIALLMSNNHVLFSHAEMTYFAPYDPTIYGGVYDVLGKAEASVVREAQYMLQFGSAEQGITRIQPSAELDQLMTGDLCSFDPKRAEELVPGITQQYAHLFVLCPTFQQGILRKGLLYAFEYVMDAIDAMLNAPNKAMLPLFFGAPIIPGTLIALLVDYTVQINELYHDYVFPLLLVAGALYKEVAISLYDDFNAYYLIAFIVFIIFNVLSYWILFHPSSHALSIASNQTKSMMLLLPPQICHVGAAKAYIDEYISLE